MSPVSAAEHPATVNFLARHPLADAAVVAGVVKDLVDGMRRRFPHVDIDRLLGHKDRADADTVRRVLVSAGRSLDEIDMIVPPKPARRYSDDQLAASGMTAAEMMAAEPSLGASRAERLTAFAQPLTAALLETAVQVVDKGASVAGAAKYAGMSYNTVNWAVRRLRFQRISV